MLPFPPTPQGRDVESRHGPLPRGALALDVLQGGSTYSTTYSCHNGGRGMAALPVWNKHCRRFLLLGSIDGYFNPFAFRMAVCSNALRLHREATYPLSLCEGTRHAPESPCGHREGYLTAGPYARTGGRGGYGNMWAADNIHCFFVCV